MVVGLFKRDKKKKPTKDMKACPLLTTPVLLRNHAEQVDSMTRLLQEGDFLTVLGTKANLTKVRSVMVRAKNE
jgi:hypothetical protein